VIPGGSLRFEDVLAVPGSRGGFDVDLAREDSLARLTRALDRLPRGTGPS